MTVAGLEHEGKENEDTGNSVRAAKWALVIHCETLRGKLGAVLGKTSAGDTHGSSRLSLLSLSSFM